MWQRRLVEISMPWAKYKALQPLPPAHMRGRVAGNEAANWFEVSGLRSVVEWERALSVAWKTFRDFPTIVDFGCGCGRTLRHLRPRLAIGQQLIGADVDQEAVEWVAKNYRNVKAIKLDLLPPSALQAKSVDLIVNHSVFTHLPEDVQLAWLDELHRVLKTGGFLLLSFQGAKVANDFFAHLVAEGHAEAAEDFKKRYSEYGFFHVRGRGVFEQALPEYYGSTYHSIEYIQEKWLRWFRCLAWLPVFALDHQDVLLLQKVAKSGAGAG